MKETAKNQNSIRRERFIRIVERRVNKILDDFDSLGKCANKKNYEYSNKDVRKLFSAVEDKLKELKALYRNSSNGPKRVFKLED